MSNSRYLYKFTERFNYLLYEKGKLCNVAWMCCRNECAASEVGVTSDDSSRSASALCQIDEIIIEENIACLPVVTADPASAAINTTANCDFSRTNARKAPTHL